MDETAGLIRTKLARRGFVMTGLIGGFTLATTRVEAQAIHTDTEGLVASPVMVPAADGNVPAYFARPAQGGHFPTVLVIEEIFGVHEYIRDVCRRLAKAGYLAVAPELYAREGDLSKMTSAAEIVRDVISRTPDAQICSDLDATATWAATHRGDPARLAVMGFCRGGRDTWLYAAHNPHLKAAVAWYGPLGGARTPIQPKTALDVAGEIKCPLLGLYGGKDPSSSPQQIAEAEATAKAAGQLATIVVYPDAPHGFHADYRPSYRKADAEDGWRRALAWLQEYDRG